MKFTSKIINILFLIFIFNSVSCEKGSDPTEDNVFVPSHEWQVVKKGQRIPKGLHVRVNFETGVTEAKILDENEKEVKDKNTQVLELPRSEEDDTLIDTEVLKEALKKIENDDLIKPDDIKKIKDQFRSYETLKEEMGHLNLTPKIDAEVLQDLFKQHKLEIEKENVDVFTISRILEDFDFLAHQIDNGIEFVKQNGFREVIYNNLNLTNAQIKQETLKLFGSLLQNNPKVQIHALETGSIAILLRLMSLEESSQVKSRAVYALSCLLRRFPLAQLRFVENGGLSVVTKLLEKDTTKVQLKLVTLMNDLIVENIHANEHKQNNNAENQYRLVNLEHLLLEQNWCQNLDKLLITLVSTDLEDHDAVEKCLLAMHTVAKKCIEHFNKAILATLHTRYKSLMEKEKTRMDEYSNLNYFQQIYNMCNDIISVNNVKTEL